MQTIILGDGPLGWAIAAAAGERGERIPIIGRPAFVGTTRTAFAGADLVVDASRGRRASPTWRPGSRPAAGDSSSRRPAGRPIESPSSVPWPRRAPPRSSQRNFSLGVALFGRLVEAAAELFGAVDGFDPFLVEWHRRAKADRPSGTALDLARRIVPPIARPARGPTISRSSRSGPARRPACTWSASMPPARRSSCG